MQYNFNEIEAKWQKFWADNQTFKAENHSQKEKFYVLDMFPYPSGAGLHVGHPLGYIASDIYARYKRHKGFNVLHPQGYDSFGLPAEQYAIQTGQHPAITTEANIKTYRRQLDQIGFSFDWSREVRTSNPSYYKWTQWIFIQLFNSWYNKDSDKAEDIETLTVMFQKDGNTKVHAVCDDDITPFSAAEWAKFSSKEQQEILLKYRLTYLADTEVNWVPALGTVLANDEIVNGVSERGGHPVIRKKMTQWSMRITAYAQRLLDGLDTIDWPQPLKDSQTNWIGRSEGAEVIFPIPAFPEGEGTPSVPRYMTGGNNSHLSLERAKEMRNNPTPAEDALWQSIKSKKVGHKFRRQHLIDNYIVDFVCLAKKLVVEVDGDIHDLQKEEDEIRTAVLNELGFIVLRFRNERVLGNIDAVLEEIATCLDNRKVPPSGVKGISVFTTRPDTIFGVSFMTLAPEHELVPKITTPDQKAEVDAYIEATAKRSERDRMADVKTITGAFTGAYAEHPFTKEPIPIWIGDYVLAGYGTGAVMSVPCGDQRDWDFAKHFGIPIPNIFQGIDISEGAFSDKEKTIIANSDFLNGLPYKKAVKTAIYELEKLGQGKGKVNYRLRDAVFSRQRYWGEPFPVYYDASGMPQMLDEKFLPLELPEVDKYLPTETGEPPLGNAKKWHWLQYGDEGKVVSKEEFEKAISETERSRSDEIKGGPLELNTMPGWAGSSQYFNRYMDPHNEDEIFSQEAINYWQDVDLYIGGSEHATGHLLYSRFWQKFMFDKGLVPKDEFAKKLINQGMITGESAFLRRIVNGYYQYQEGISQNELEESEKEFESIFDTYFLNNVVSWDLLKGKKQHDAIAGELYKLADVFPKDIIEEIFESSKFDVDKITFTVSKIHVDVACVDLKNQLILNKFFDFYKEDTSPSELFMTNGTYSVSREVEKMSKSKYNVVNPDDIVQEYGADSLRLYEMFLGPLEQSKPWNTAGITGVHSFLKKLWKLYHSGPNGEFKASIAPPSGESEGALKTLHKTIKKVEEDIENFSFNTSVSTFMICVNELTAQKCSSREILEPLAILVSPYAPHIAEELWEKLGHTESIATAPFPKFEPKYLVESDKEYPISFNGKMRFTMNLPLDLSKEEIESAVMANEKTQEQLQGRTPKKVIVVPGKIVNIVG
ncbi:leucine--tRNA ligase [Aggregatimonas sangjinii]|uniref:Leucine--tRNA ligase n=1 Tax=Aggregatimonas sangjinii TaxID=2583587 RepID=A0A5B7SMF7_9FLAO|nr:DUF559 domain-containing protein [Aggregatimonas sangjinii]QCW98578.1 leucine--tRNA ligase [Aggregatimonas sangjinii]